MLNKMTKKDKFHSH